MEGDDGIDLPIASDGIDRFVQVMAESASATERNVIGNITVQRLRHIVVATAVVRVGIVGVLPVIVVTSTLTIATVVTDGVGKAMRPGVIDLEFKAMLQTFLEADLKGIVILNAISDGEFIRGLSAARVGLPAR